MCWKNTLVGSPTYQASSEFLHERDVEGTTVDPIHMGCCVRNTVSVDVKGPYRSICFQIRIFTDLTGFLVGILKNS